MASIKPQTLANNETQTITDEESAFEMIELACGEIDQLTRAFKVIDSVCQELAAEVAEEVETDGKFIMH